MNKGTKILTVGGDLRQKYMVDHLNGYGFEIECYAVEDINENNRSDLKSLIHGADASDLISEIEDICGRKVIASIIEAKTLGPVIKPDIMVIEPCTGNTLAKLAWGINDTPVTLFAKAVMRNEKPLVIAVSSNDALSVSA